MRCDKNIEYGQDLINILFMTIYNVTSLDWLLIFKVFFPDKYRLFASMAFMIVVIIVGVPMWWKTTEVYR